MQTNTIKLKDNRTLSFAQYGDSKGKPVFLLMYSQNIKRWFDMHLEYVDVSKKRVEALKVHPM